MILRYILALAAALLTTQAVAAPPVASLVASRTTGTAPLCVHFDATGTTDSDTTRPFHDLLYRWSFGDPGAGSWGRGANPSFNRNVARGPVAAHCYMNPGTYTATLSVTDGTSTSIRTATITVANPDTVYSGNNTICVGNTLPTAGSGGCPAGALTVASSDFDAVQAAHLTTGKRVLLRRGDVFASDQEWSTVNNTGWQIGAFGSGANPIVNFNFGTNGYLYNFSTSRVYDVVIRDIDHIGPAAPGLGGCYKAATTNSERVTIINTRCFEGGNGNGSSGTSRMTEWFVVGNDLRDVASGASWFGYTVRSAYMGNLIGSRFPYPQEHGIRLQHAYKVAVSHNEFVRVSPTKGLLTIRGTDNTWNSWTENDTQYVYVSDNRVDGRNGVDQGLMSFSPSSVDDCQWGRHAIFERNLLLSDTASNTMMHTVWPDFTGRNNIFILEYTTANPPAAPIFFTAIGNNDGTCAGGGTFPLPEQAARAVFENNSMFERSFDAAGSPSDPVRFGRTIPAADPTYRNNLIWMPFSTHVRVRMPYLESVSGTVINTNNSTDSNNGNQFRTVNPLWAVADPVDPIQFRPAVGSYATGGGVATFPSTAEDFFLCRDRTGAHRMGAVVPRARAQCMGGAQ